VGPDTDKPAGVELGGRTGALISAIE